MIFSDLPALVQISLHLLQSLAKMGLLVEAELQWRLMTCRTEAGGNGEGSAATSVQQPTRHVLAISWSLQWVLALLWMFTWHWGPNIFFSSFLLLVLLKSSSIFFWMCSHRNCLPLCFSAAHPSQRLLRNLRQCRTREVGPVSLKEITQCELDSGTLFHVYVSTPVLYKEDLSRVSECC